MSALLVLIAGPYRSGTDGDAVRIAANLQRLEAAALDVYRRGHLPMIGEWVALPLSVAAGSTHPGDAISETFLYPVAHRLLRRCDAVLRIAGASRGADADERIARELGLPVYRSTGRQKNCRTSRIHKPAFLTRPRIPHHFLPNRKTV